MAKKSEGSHSQVREDMKLLEGKNHYNPYGNQLTFTRVNENDEIIGNVE